MLKKSFDEYCHNLLNTADWNSYKHVFLFCFMYSTVHIFWHLTKQLQHLLENNQLLYSLYCSLLTSPPPRTYCSSGYVFKNSHCQSVFKLIIVSLANKTVQNNTGLNSVHCKVRTFIKRSLENSSYVAQNSESTFHIPSRSAQPILVHSF